MKKISFLLFCFVTQFSQLWAQSATIKSCSIAPSDNYESVIVKVTFNIAGYLGKKCNVVVYFGKEDGTDLVDLNQRYYTASGKVSSSTDFCPPYESTNYTDLEISIPMHELHLPEGSYKLKYDVALFHGNQCVAQKNKNYFDLSLYSSICTLSYNEPDGTRVTHKILYCTLCTGRGTCLLCHGTGKTMMYTCMSCGGNGVCIHCKGAGVDSKTVERTAPTQYDNSHNNPNANPNRSTSIPNTSGGSYGGGYTGGSSSLTGSSSSSSRSVPQTCSWCNGTGKGADEIIWQPNYTGEDNSQWCSQCGRTSPAHSHRQSMCRVCNGRGKI